MRLREDGVEKERSSNKSLVNLLRIYEEGSRCKIQRRMLRDVRQLGAKNTFT